MNKTCYWLIVPAAGKGRRFGGDLPKQYLELSGRSVLAHSLQTFADWGELSATVIATNPDDANFSRVASDLPLPYRVVKGGAERMFSVLNGLEALAEEAGEQDWVLVHDAVRPCLHLDDLRTLVGRAAETGSGGTLAIKVADTLKRENPAAGTGPIIVEKTVNREGLWQALTPQIFPFGLLRSALQTAAGKRQVFGDEASAMEQAGHQVLLIEGRRDNIKITHAEDLPLVAAIISTRGED